MIQKILLVILALYILICVLLYIFQEKFIFHPQKLNADYILGTGPYTEELNIVAEDGIRLNSLLFKVDSPKGLIFYLHGNAGSLASWGGVAELYNELGYDVFILDYRGYGKSEGEIQSEQQLFEDNQVAYELMSERYDEDSITVLGYSIGTGMAAQLASTNHPRLLILQAPYYSLSDLMQKWIPIVPRFLLRYPLATHQYLHSCDMPVIIFHGTEDEVIYYGSSEKLSLEFKDGDRLIPLPGQGHNGMTDNVDYQKAIADILR